MKKQSLILYSVIFLSVIGIDQALKWYVPGLGNASYAIIHGLTCERSFNSGVSWGLFQTADQSISFTLLALIIAVITGLSVHMYFRFKARASIVGDILVIAGAVSNLIDRLIHGAVVDFIRIGYAGTYFPTFNVADTAIVGGVLLMILQEYAYSS